MIRFRVEWQDAPGVKDMVLARTWCRLTIEADGRLVTEVLDNRSRSLRGGIYGSVFPLSQWIVENWWFLLNESYRFPAAYGSRDLARTPGDRTWIQRHSMLAARQGGVLPDLTIYRDEKSVVARWMPDGGDSAHPFLRFTGSGEIQMDPDEVKRGLAELVDQVMDRLEGLEDTEVGMLREEWAGILGSTEEDREICEWSARLGLDPHDPDELADDQAEAIATLISPLEDSVKNDLLDAEQFESLQSDLEWLNQARSLAADAGGCLNSAPTLSKVEGRTAHELGYTSATALRHHLSSSDECEPIGDMDDILHRLGWAQSPSRTLGPRPEGPLKVALEQSDDGASVAVSPNGDAAGERFGLARSIFLRHFGSSGCNRRLVTEAHTREQRASRAFAAEFMAPAAGLSRHIGERVSHSEIDHLAAHYAVSPSVIFHQIQNHRLAWINA